MATVSKELVLGGDLFWEVLCVWVFCLGDYINTN